MLHWYCRDCGTYEHTSVAVVLVYHHHDPTPVALEPLSERDYYQHRERVQTALDKNTVQRRETTPAARRDDAP